MKNNHNILIIIVVINHMINGGIPIIVINHIYGRHPAVITKILFIFEKAEAKLTLNQI